MGRKGKGKGRDRGSDRGGNTLTGSVIELNGHTVGEVSNVRVWVNVNPL